MMVREKLAAYAHKAWSGWMKYMFGKSVKNSGGSVTIPAPLVERWTRQMNTDYENLPESEKLSDRLEADQMLEIVKAENKELQSLPSQLATIRKAMDEYQEYRRMNTLNFQLEKADSYIAAIEVAITACEQRRE